MRSPSLLYWSSSASAPYNWAAGKRGESTTSGVNPARQSATVPLLRSLLSPIYCTVYHRQGWRKDFLSPSNRRLSKEFQLKCSTSIISDMAITLEKPNDIRTHRADMRESNLYLTLVIELLTSTIINQRSCLGQYFLMNRV